MSERLKEFLKKAVDRTLQVPPIQELDQGTQSGVAGIPADQRRDVLVL